MTQKAKVKLLYESKGFPIFQNRMYDSSKEAIECPKGDVRLVENLETGLVYNDSFLPEMMIYDANYQNEQGVSALFQQHLSSMAKVIKQSMGEFNLVEVGCGKGFFLEMLLKQGVDVIGFDPTYEGSNPRIEKRYFESDSGIKANGIILRHVLEHVQDPVNFLMMLQKSNGGSGLVFIEVPCFDWICRQRAWFDIFYEHVNYFRMSDFYRIFDNIIESGSVFGDQYLYVVADLASLKQPVIKPVINSGVNAVVNIEGRVSFPADFLSRLKDKTGKAIWGGASKGVIFSFLKYRQGQPIEIVMDINPFKQNKYIAGTGLCVMSPEKGMSLLQKGSTIYVMNSNYLAEIKKMSNYAYNYVSVDHV